MAMALVAEWILIWLAILLTVLLLWLVVLHPRLTRHRQVRELLTFDYAHRGYHKEDGTLPENSMAAFRRAIQSGFAIELDVQLTKDKRVVVHHDDSLRRICGAGVLISSLTYEELCSYPLQQTTERVPLFSDVLRLVNGKVPLLVEIKNYNDLHELCELVCELTDRYHGAFCIESFDPRIVLWFRKNRPAIPRGQLVTHFTRDMTGFSGPVNAMLRNLFTNFITSPDFIAYDWRYRKNLSFRLAKAVYRVPEFSWTVTDKNTCRLLKAEGAACIFEQFDPRTLLKK